MVINNKKYFNKKIADFLIQKSFVNKKKIEDNLKLKKKKNLMNKQKIQYKNNNL